MGFSKAIRSIGAFVKPNKKLDSSLRLFGTFRSALIPVQSTAANESAIREENTQVPSMIQHAQDISNDVLAFAWNEINRIGVMASFQERIAHYSEPFAPN
jgi:hypothetical protein